MPIQAVKINQNSLSEADITNYWQHYGLKHDPFASEVSDENYFSIPRWEEYLDLLQFLCHYKNVLLIVTGTNCSGKTTLLKQFNRQLSESARICEIKANTSFTSERLVKVLGEQFNLPLNPNAPIEEQMDEQISLLQESPKICILAIDDAHLLPNQVMRNLIYLVQQQSESQMKLHIVLFGEPHLQANVTRLCQAQGAEEEMIHTLNIGLLSLEETESYLEYRLRKAGFEEMPLIQTVINRIYKLSAGAPGRINRIARRTLLNDLIKHKPEEAKGFLGTHKTKLFGAFLFSILCVALALTFKWAKLGDGFSVLKQNKLPVALPLLTKPVIQGTDTINDGVIQTTATLPATPTPLMPENTQTTQQVTVSPEPSKPEVLTSTPAPTQDAVTVTSTAPTQTSATTLQDAKMLQALTTATQTNAAEPVKKLATPKSEPKVAAAKVPTKSEAHLLSIPVSSFGLQLSGLSKESAVKRFIAQNNLTNKAFYYHSHLNGKDWYVIIYGQFKSPSEAKDAVNGLPDAVQELKPWVRPYSSVHKSIREAQKR